MYTIGVKKDFIARHFLIGGEWGMENKVHAHHYRLEVQLKGAELDEHGYLLDITELNAALEHLIAAYRDKTLNDLPEFAGLNPSIEHFARVLHEKLIAELHSPGVQRIKVRLWEDELAWAAYTGKTPCT
jgi:6-pyruvoyltetrahydropterin/6-carboxytetrahydropterin synthase